MLEGILYGSELSKVTRNVQALESARALLVRYAVRSISGSQFTLSVKQLPGKVRDLVFSVKRKFFDRTEYFLSCLWRAFYAHLRDCLKVEVACKRFRAKPEDIYIIQSLLSTKEINKIRRTSINLTRLSNWSVGAIHRAISKHANTLLCRGQVSPRWISMNDPGYSVDDIKKLLIEEGHRLFLYYEHFRDPARIRNYVKRGMQNWCVNFILYNRAECRQAISDSKGDGSREYCLTRTSLDAQVEGPNNDDSGHSLSEILSDNRMVRPDILLEQKSLIHSLETSTDEGVRDFVDIIIGDSHNDDFCEWLYSVHGITPEQTNSDYFKLGTFAMEYLGVNRETLVSHLLPHLTGKTVSPSC